MCRSFADWNGGEWNGGRLGSSDDGGGVGSRDGLELVEEVADGGVEVVDAAAVFDGDVDGAGGWLDARRRVERDGVRHGRDRRPGRGGGGVVVVAAQEVVVAWFLLLRRRRRRELFFVRATVPRHHPSFACIIIFRRC